MRKKLFMLKKLYRDLNSSPPAINTDNNSTLGYYYLMFQNNPKKLNRLIAEFDNNGVPLNNAYIDVENPQLHYYPISIGQFGLSIFHSYLKHKREDDKNHFLRIADWFVENANVDDKLGAYWLTEVDKPEFNVHLPWKSAFTQSRALSILLRAWQITKLEHYKNLAIKALVPYTFDISDGGVKCGHQNQIIYEEYVAEKPTRILDGAIFSLFGLYDAQRALHGYDSKAYDLAHSLIEKGIIGLVYWLPKYDMGYWVYYNRCEIKGYPKNDPCTIGYLKLVSSQLKILHSLSKNDTFKSYSLKFESYLKPTNIIKMYIEKYKALKSLNRI